jgi:hypothetical protein
MTDTTSSPAKADRRLWAGWALSGLFIAFMLMDVSMKLLDFDVVKTAMTQLGYPAEDGFLIGVIEAICLILYVVPRSSVLGAILLTAVMGGAIASHLRMGDPLFTHILFGVYLGLFMWGGLWFRNARLRALVPLGAA